MRCGTELAKTWARELGILVVQVIFAAFLLGGVLLPVILLGVTLL